MNEAYQPFRLRASLLTPIVVGKSPPHLDGILSYAVWQHTGIESIEDINDYIANRLLLRNEAHGIFHGSAMMLGVDGKNVLRRHNFVRPGRLRQEELTEWYFAPNGKGGRYVKATADGGLKAPRLTKERAIMALSVVFYGVGDRHAVSELLNQYVWSVGRNARAGVIGEVGSFTTEPMEQDLSLLSESGSPNRNLPPHPEFSTDGMMAEEGRLRIPYFHPGETESVIPVQRIMKCED